jgi:hypothetical protein
MKEEWKIIGDCKVSNYGKVLSIKSGKLKHLNKNPDGYLQVWVAGKLERVHRLVAEAFVPNPENKPEIDHIDTNRSNNISSNLRWVTHKENCNHPHFIEVQTERLNAFNEMKKRPLIKMDLNNKVVEVLASLTEAKKRYGFDIPTIKQSISRNTTAYGYKWKFKNK